MKINISVKEFKELTNQSTSVVYKTVSLPDSMTTFNLLNEDVRQNLSLSTITEILNCLNSYLEISTKK